MEGILEEKAKTSERAGICMWETDFVDCFHLGLGINFTFLVSVLALYIIFF